jgi:acyl-lipid omega-6 desaturase (Delta-12 desaturase)
MIDSRLVEAPTKTAIKKSDFVLTPYMKSDNFIATWQILNTVVPYLLLWALAFKAVEISVWLLLPIVVLMTLFSARCFSLMHDCGHYSLFTDKKVNRTVGFLLGIINAIPQYGWSRGHAYHHKHNGDWDMYRGPGALASAAQFAGLSPVRQQFYAFLRHPLMLFPGGFFYLIIKPRLALILGTVGLVKHLVTCLKQDSGMSISTIFATYKTKHWYTTEEFWDLLWNNICVIGSWFYLSNLLGAGFFWSVYSIVMACSAAIFICIFFIQHNFEGSYAHKTAGWDYLLGAIEGSSYLKLPAILNWFSADIGYHNIHHLSERIPNYQLQACHQANSHLLTDAKVLTIRELPSCFKFLIWDAANDTLQSIESLPDRGSQPERIVG